MPDESLHYRLRISAGAENLFDYARDFWGAEHGKRFKRYRANIREWTLEAMGDANFTRLMTKVCYYFGERVLDNARYPVGVRFINAVLETLIQVDEYSLAIHVARAYHEEGAYGSQEILTQTQQMLLERFESLERDRAIAALEVIKTEVKEYPISNSKTEQASEK